MRPTKDVLSEVQEQLDLATSKYGSLMERLNMFKKLSEQSIATTEVENDINTTPNCPENEEIITTPNGIDEDNSYDLAPGDENDEFFQPNESLLEEDQPYFLMNSEIELDDRQLQFQGFHCNSLTEPFEESEFQHSENQTDENSLSHSNIYGSPISWETQSLNGPTIASRTKYDSCSLKENVKIKRATSIKTSHSSRKLRLQRIYRGVPKKNRNGLSVPARWHEVKRNKTVEPKVEPKKGNLQRKRDNQHDSKKKTTKTKVRSISPTEFKKRFPNIERLSRPKQWKDSNDVSKDKPKEKIETPSSPDVSVAESNVALHDRPKPIFDGIKLDDIVPSAVKSNSPSRPKKKDDMNKRDGSKKIIYEKIKETESSEFFEPQLVIHNADNGPSFEWTNIHYKESCDSLKEYKSYSQMNLPQKSLKKQYNASELNFRQSIKTKQQVQRKSNLIPKIERLSVLTSSKGYEEAGVNIFESKKKKSSIHQKQEVLKPVADLIDEGPTTKVDFAHKVGPKIAQACKGLSNTLLLAECIENDNVGKSIGKSDDGRGDCVKNVGRIGGQLKVRPWNAGSGLRDRINKSTSNKKKDLFPHVSSRVFRFMGKENREKEVEQAKIEEIPEALEKEEKKKTTVNKQAKIPRYGSLTKENVSQIKKQHNEVYLQRDSLSEKNFVKKPEQAGKKPAFLNPPRTAPHREAVREIPKIRPEPEKRGKHADGVRFDHLHGGGDSEKLETRNRKNELLYDDNSKLSNMSLLFPSSENGLRRSIYNTIPFIVGQSTTKSHNLGLSIQETLAALRANQPNTKESTENFDDLEELPDISNSCFHKCPAMEGPPPPVDDEDAWAVPQRDPYDDPVQPKRNICTCYSRNSQNLSTVIKEFLIQMVGNKFREEQPLEKNELMIVPTGCQDDDVLYSSDSSW